jgi:DNA-binding Lrp family transcriptional regulator
MHKIPDIDPFNRKILALLQQDGRLTNNDLSEQVNLSPSQCSRRRMWLEQAGFITHYRAQLSRDKMDLSLISIVSVTLATHNPDNANKFAALVKALPNVLEAYSLTGEMDYHIKVVTPDLKALSDFVNESLLPHDAVQNVKTAIVLDVLKDTSQLPF